jgi:LytS/YehU family sensor histidine kinase
MIYIVMSHIWHGVRLSGHLSQILSKRHKNITLLHLINEKHAFMSTNVARFEDVLNVLYDGGYIDSTTSAVLRETSKGCHSFL